MVDVTDSANWIFGLSSDEVLRKRARRDEIPGQIEALAKEKEELDRWLDAVSLIVPPEVKAALLWDMPETERESEWRTAIAAVLQTATRGMFPKDISQGIRERGGPAKERLERNPNGIYNALKRMVEDGHIVRVGERVYTVGLFNALKQAGKLEEEDDDEQFSIAEAILGIVARGEVLTAAQIIRKLRENPIALDKMRRNPQYSYAAMSRLVSKGQLIKDGPHSYRRPTTKEKIAHLL